MQSARSALMHSVLLFVLAIPVLGEEPSTTSFSESDLEFFEKKVRPLLVQHCYECHGPEEQEGSLRLDSRKSLLKGGDTGPAVIPGQPKKSEMIAALRHDPDGYQMPPSGKLPSKEIALLTEWVKRGAPWPAEEVDEQQTGEEFNLTERARHWSFQPVVRPPVPAVQNKDWAQQPIDLFILDKLEQAQLAPSVDTDKRTWIRRVTFDLIGLPPTRAEIQEYLEDESSQAEEKVVDRLLASSQYGVRWGRHWLDLVRFSETYGHEFDYNIPHAWRYRDYVIRALNQDLPYDQFIQEHIAGDLFETPRRDPQTGNNESAVATAFYWLGQGKHSPVDIRAEECDTVENQIDVMTKTFLGLTVSCARCHDHKFDPITTKDYYALAGYLQSSRQEYRIINDTPDVQQTLLELHQLSQQEGVSLSRELLELAKEQMQKQESSFRNNLEQTIASLDKNEFQRIEDHADTNDFMRSASTSWRDSGWAFSPQNLSGEVVLSEEPDSPMQLTEGRTIHSGKYGGQLQGALRSNTFPIKQKYIHYRVRRTGPVRSAGRGFKEGQLNLIVDGFQIIKPPLYGNLSLKVPNDGKIHWLKQDVSKFLGANAYLEILDEDESAIEVSEILFSDQSELPVNETKPDYSEVKKALIKSLESSTELSPEESQLVNMICKSIWSHLPGKLNHRVAQFHKRVNSVKENLPIPERTIAIVEGSSENEHVMIRGNHKKVGDQVPRRFLEVFDSEPVSPEEKGSGRLGLAKQIASPENPFTARVMVNRIWMHYFGRGIVPTPDNLGVLGQLPTHPELLDYLAYDFMQQGWSLKKLHKQFVLSRTYRMTSQMATPEIEEKDPGNQLWHRMPLKRLEGEIVRDAILAISGELDSSMYGPGVAPYLTPFMEGRGRPSQSGPLDGDGRRSIYLNVRRNFLNPLFLAFDYPTPMTTTGRRSVSNVPAQALTMMNNPFVVQQAASWIRNRYSDSSKNQEEQIQQMYEEAFGRPALPEEVEWGIQFLEDQLREYHDDDHSEQKAWNDYAHVLFNLKEFIYLR